LSLTLACLDYVKQFFYLQITIKSTLTIMDQGNKLCAIALL
ncbi:MAG: hypothetical protein QOD00_1958, partial [Blastocatellia bacterium]|nr:hypothetical protein [Blastocatellia bacterium]